MDKELTGVSDVVYTFDTNNDYPNALGYIDVETTNTYRQGRPYKLFGTPGKSSAVFTLDLPKVCRVLKLEMTLNHCRTNCNGTIDIKINGRFFREGYSYARWDEFGEQTFQIPLNLLTDGENTFAIILTKESRGVYWLSDIQFQLKHT
ncbi:uncharacterized protein LOC134709359 [Mytilus trossulus]|uniref:uncharacterized protein LOC134709359 n=1 Tax=Mytilus trossulus TaxID=6551 RepID=UPI0030069304